MRLKKILSKIKKASGVLSQVNNAGKNKFLQNLRQFLLVEKKKILAANKKDIIIADHNNLSKTFIDRLRLDEKGINSIAQRLNNLQSIDNPIGKILEEKLLANGLILKKVSVPLGVIFVIFESRPEVTIDVAALCFKSGNVAILKGGSETINTNKILFQCIRAALKESNIVKETITFVSGRKRKIIDSLLKQNQYIDLVIARGAYSLVKSVLNKSKIPVLAHSSGGARIYVDKSADFNIAEKIIINAKISKPAACNSVDTILVHVDIVSKFIPNLVKKLQSSGVEVKGDSKVCQLASIKKAKEKDWEKEFLDLIVAVRVVNNIDKAIDHINKYTKHHTEGIVAKDKKVIEKFINSIDAAAVFINCSTRLHDGGVFGMGAEMGISTGKLHARGPVGLRELTTYKWIITGNGQVR